ncbi:MAG: glutathione S-transferase N-terminal domain-containing protein [Deltaproteobacteria bacterium]|nr:glutathione S-transferase N-terminal domain-containing protein [Deltaproteobacteria bacterium]MBW2393961.1 glutathione S-transferase N-terminal domain-containing protein [Deltaproteobacteria bacterium]
MIDFYYWPTPNGWKISIALEEMELPYETHWVNIGRGAQFGTEFLAISPNGRMPAIVDREPTGGGEPLSIFESGAILIYLAEKCGQFLPDDPGGRFDVLQWLFWQVGGVGPMFGQFGHFNLYADQKVPYALDRYGREARRLYGVMDTQLAKHEHLAGNYSIADMATWPWVVTYKRNGIDLAGDFPNVRRWYDALKERPGLRRGYDLGKEGRKALTTGPDEEGRKNLFGRS